MATNLIRKLYHTGRRALLRAFVGYQAIRGAVHRYQKASDVRGRNEAKAKLKAGKAAFREQQQAVRARKLAVKSRVRGVRKVTKTVTSGSRIERANQLRQLRQNPHTRSALRRRVKFYTTK